MPSAQPATCAAVLLGLTLSLAGPAALAAPSGQASASVNNFHVSVIDITPDDGIDAGYSVAHTVLAFDGAMQWFTVGTGDFADSGGVSTDFSYSYLNNSATTHYMNLEMSVRAWSAYVDAAAPVPEPASYAMFGLGALIVGAMSRKRRQEAAA
ncbi:MAG: PEP-CTERM sorting domain-containing protein [Pseudomonadota bacterium]